MSEAKYLGRDAILAAPDLVFEDVKVPEWGGVVRVRGMTGAERDAWELELLKEDAATRNIRAKLVSLTVVDENGQRIFSEADVAKLGQKNVKALERVFVVAQRLSKVTKSDVKELEGN